MTTTTRKTLAELNEGFRREGTTSDFDTLTEYRCGKWGLAYSRDGYSGSGSGGDKLHVSVVTVITAIHPDYGWEKYCFESLRVSSWSTRDQADRQRAKHLADHGQPWHHCRQPKVGDVIRVNPVCRFENVRGTAAWTPEQVDTDRVTCLNCRRQFFHEAVDGVEERRRERAGVEERKAAKPKPARCFWCGEVRPHTAKTRAGEQLPCSSCKDDMELIWFVETTGYTCQYHADMADERDAEHSAAMQADAVTREDYAYKALVAREGKYFR